MTHKTPSIELALLAASIVLGIVHIVIVSHLQSRQRGYRWTASLRGQSVAPLTGFAGRAQRAPRNYLETFPFFAAAILSVTLANTHSWLTLRGAHFYFWCHFSADSTPAPRDKWNRID